MAKIFVYSLYDSKVQAFACPWFMRARGEAIRAVEEVVNDPNSVVCRHPEDFTIMELGEYDDANGQFTNHTAPVNLGPAASLRRQAVPQNQPLPFAEITKVQDEEWARKGNQK